MSQCHRNNAETLGGSTTLIWRHQKRQSLSGIGLIFIEIPDSETGKNDILF